MRNRFENEELWKKYALFLKEHLSQNELSIAGVSENAGMHRNTLRRFLQLETSMKFDAFIMLVDSLDLKLVFKPKIEGEILEVYDFEDFEGKKEDLSPPVLDTVKVVSINRTDLSILTDGEFRFYPLLDLCDVIRKNYTREFQKINRNEDLSKYLFMARIQEKGEYQRDVYVIPEEQLTSWFFTITAKTMKATEKMIV